MKSYDNKTAKGRWPSKLVKRTSVNMVQATLALAEAASRRTLFGLVAKD